MTERIVCALLSLGLPWAAACGADLLADFQPTTLENAHGAVSQVQFSTNDVIITAGALAYHPPGSVRDFYFDEPVWIIAYRTEIVDALGKPPAENYQCHSFFSDQWVKAEQDQQMRGIFSDAYTQHVELPDGFGLRFESGETLHWMTMFNNRGAEAARVAMRVELTVIREKDLRKPLWRLRSTTRSVRVPPLFWVPPGRHVFEEDIQLPFAGRIHYIGAHVHPYAESIELVNLTREETVWHGSVHANEAGEPVRMDVYSSTDGYRVRPGERYRIASVYNNLTSKHVDAMAGVFVFYSVDE